MNREQATEFNITIPADRMRNVRIGIVVSKFNHDITEKLLSGALDTLHSNGVLDNNITVKYVPGGFEIPLECQRLAQPSQKYDALIAIGCVIKGNTDHYYYIASESTRGIMEVMLKMETPISNCILTVETLEQANIRCLDNNNKGSEAALAALSMIH